MKEPSSFGGPILMEPFARLHAALAARYTVECELSRGGMATVYLAQDLKHKRQVAVKGRRPTALYQAAALSALRLPEPVLCRIFTSLVRRWP